MLPTPITEQRVKIPLILFKFLCRDQAADSIGIQVEQHFTAWIAKGFGNDSKWQARRAERVDEGKRRSKSLALSPQICQDAANLLLEASRFDVPLDIRQPGTSGHGCLKVHDEVPSLFHKEKGELNITELCALALNRGLRGLKCSYRGTLLAV